MLSVWGTSDLATACSLLFLRLYVPPRSPTCLSVCLSVCDLRISETLLAVLNVLHACACLRRSPIHLADFVLVSFTWPDDYPNSPARFALPVTTDAGNINYRLSEDAKKKVVERLNEEVRTRDLSQSHRAYTQTLTAYHS